MKKKLLSIMLALLAVCSFFVACNGDIWKNDLPCEHRQLTKVEATESSCTKEGNIEFYVCACGRLFTDNTAQTEITDEKSVVLAKKAHTFSCKNTAEEYLKSESTCTTKAVYYYSCVCGEKGTETFEYGEFADHTYSSTWSYNDTHHWHVSTCGCDVAQNYAEHTLNDDGVCTICENVISKPSGIVYTLSADGTYYVVTDYVGTATNVRMDEKYKGLPVKEIADKAFYFNTTVAELTIPDSVTLIGDLAFSCCSSLTSVTIGNGVTSIGFNAFSSCYKLVEVINKSRLDITKDSSYGEYANGGVAYYALSVKDEGASDIVNVDDYLFLTVDATNFLIGYAGNKTDLVLPDKYNGQNYVINQYAFYDCSILTSVSIGDGVTSIGRRAFQYCYNLTSVTIGNSVASLGYDSFKDCDKLVEVINKSSLDIEKGSWGNGYVADYALNVKTEGTSDIVNVDDYLFYTYNGTNYLLGYVGNKTNLVLPDKYNGQNYVIYEYAFYNNYDLISITIPDGVTLIYYDAFTGCYKLVEVINKSSLDITKGSSDNGGVASNALKVKTEGASDIVNVDGYLFLSVDGANYLIGYVGNKTELVLPDKYNGQNYGINQYAFYDCSSLTSVTIPDSVTSIGSSAFYNCYRLTSVTIPDSVTSIGSSAFYNCYRSTNVTIGNGMTSIGKDAFYICDSLTSVNYTGTIDQWVQIDFSNSSSNPLYYAEKLYINNELVTKAYITTATKISDYAFSNCTALTSITIPNSVTSIGSCAFRYCSSLTSITIPNSVTSIGSSAFYRCSKLTSITIPDGVTSIEDDVFYGCSQLRSVTIPDSVTSIGDSAFYNCSSLTSITIPDSVTLIGSDAFYNCSSLTSITIPDSVTSIGNDAFCDCESLTSVNYTGTIDQWVQIDFSYYFSNPLSYAKKLYINNELVTNANITTATKISDYAFSNCTALTSITIPDGVYTIGDYAFADCASLSSIMIPDSVNTIGDYAFRNCTSLTSVTIPDGLHWIGSSFGSYFGQRNAVTFYGCYKLVEVINKSSLNITKGSSNNGYVAYYALSVKTEGETDIENVDDYLFLTVDDTNYLLGYVGNKTELVLPDKYNGSNYEIYKYAFYKRAELTSVTIGSGVTSIGENAFLGCGKLVEVTNRSSLDITKGSSDNGYVAYYALDVKSVGSSNIVNVDDYLFLTVDDTNYLLGYVGNKTELVLPDKYNGQNYEINQYAFYDCSSLTSVTIPDSVTSIGEYAFNNCISLASITIPDSVTSIDNGAFRYCSSLTSVNYTGTIDQWVQIDFSSYYSNPLEYAENLYINNELVTEVNITTATKISNYAFYRYESLTSVTIGESVNSIGSYAFYWCTSITCVTIRDGVTSMGYSAFYNCNTLTTVTIPGSLTSIDGNAFFSVPALTSVYYTGTIDQWAQIDFSDGYSNPLSYAAKLYINNELVTEANLTTATKISAHAFYRYNLLTKVIIPDSVTFIGTQAFYDCSALISVTIPDSVTSIGYESFDGCSSLKEMTLPFVGTSKDATGYEAVFGYIFGYIQSSSSEWAGATCQYYDSSSSSSCKYYHFYIPAHLTKVTITGDVVAHAFYNCSMLKNITIGNGVTSIGERAFSGCLNLTSVYYKGTETEWNEITIESGNDYLTSATRYYYSESNPFEGESAVEGGNYWHYDADGKTLVIWKKDN